MSSNTASIDNNLGMIASSDYKFNTCQLVTSDGQVVDIRGLIVELNLYEDIFSPVMTGSITLGDALDLVSSLGLHGNEYLQINIDKPSLNNPIVKTFRLYKIGNRSLGANGLQNYTLYFCSEELVIAAENLVSKSYKGLRVDQMVVDLLLKKLRVDPVKICRIEQTSGNFDFIIPRMSALEAIAWLTPRGYGPNKNLYFFYENRDGFNFMAYETLLTSPTYQTYGFNIKLGQDPVLNSNTFNVINVTQDFDMIKAIRSGAFSSTLATFDIFNRQYSAVNFNAQSLANNATLNPYLPANDAQNRFQQTVYQTDGNMLKFVISADSDPTVNPLNIKKWLPQTASRLGQLNTCKIVGAIPGDINMKVGMVIGLVVPKMQVQNRVTANDPFKTGRYLVTGVHHKFIVDTAATIIEVLNDSLSAQLPQASVGSPSIQQIIKS